MAILREIGDRQGEGNSLGNLGLAYAGLGELLKAQRYYEDAIEILTVIESPNAKAFKSWLDDLDDK